MFEVFEMYIEASGPLYSFVGIIYGLICGALPGIGPVYALALLLPLTYGMSSTTAIVLLLSTYCGAVCGGAIPAALLNMPGTNGSIATCFDGFPLTRKGYGGRSIGLVMMASALGGLIGALSLMTIGPLMGQIAAQVSSPAYFMLILFAFVMISLASRGQMVKGMFMAATGVTIAMVGRDVITGTQRFTFDVLLLQDGIPFAPAVIGMFAFAQIIVFVKEGQVVQQEGKSSEAEKGLIGKAFFGALRVFRYPFTVIRNGVTGVFFGIIPAIGINVSGLLNYTIEQSMASEENKKKFGTGYEKGIIAPESANNATAYGSLSTAFALGIPGGAADAILLAALMMHGLDIGRSFFTAETFDVFILSMYIAPLLILLIGILLSQYIVKVTFIPLKYTMPVVATLCVIGSFAYRGHMFDVYVMLAFALLGYIFTRYGFPKANLVVGLILGRELETHFNRSLIFSDGSYSIFLTDTVSLIIFIVIVILILSPFISSFFKRGSKTSAS